MDQEYGMHGHAIPKVDAIVRYPDGSFGPMMFHYLCDDCDPYEVARSHGFDMRFVSMDGDCDDALYERYADGDASAFKEWSPSPIDGWVLSGKFQGEDGPGAFHLRRIDKN